MEHFRTLPFFVGVDFEERDVEALWNHRHRLEVEGWAKSHFIPLPNFL